MKPSQEITKALFNSELLSKKQINAALKNEPDIRKALERWSPSHGVHCQDGFTMPFSAALKPFPG